MNPYRENAYVEPKSHREHGLASNVIYVGSPSMIRFCACGAIIDENFHEVETRPMREFVDGKR